MLTRFLVPVLFLTPSLLVACGSAPTEPGPAIPEQVPDTQITPEEAATQVGRIMFDCDTHLRTWIHAVQQARTEENQETIALTARALGRVVLRDKDVVLAEAVSGSPRNRGIASAALGFSGDPEVLPVLTSNATDDDPFVASKALLGIGVMADPETPTGIFWLALRREDRTEELTRNLAFAMYQIAGQTREDVDGRMAPVMIGLLKEVDPGVRWQAAVALGMVRAPLGIPDLSDLLADDPADEVRTAAAWSLGMIGSIGSTGPLMRALEDPDLICAGAARAALKRIHGEDRGPDPASWEPLAKP